MTDYDLLRASEDEVPRARARTMPWMWLVAAFAVLIAIGIATS